MRKGILIIKNKTSEGPGLLERILKRAGTGYTILDLETGEKLPGDLSGLDAVIILGGPDSANDRTDKIRSELIFIRQVLSAGIPFLGICLGLQLLVKAAGGMVVKNRVKEIGFRDPDGGFFTVDLTEKGKDDPLFRDSGASFRVFHLHGETVELSWNMSLLGEGKYCANQIVKAGDNAYGIQCHFELTRAMLEDWISADPDLAKLDHDRLRKDFENLEADYTETGEKLLMNFLKIAGIPADQTG